MSTTPNKVERDTKGRFPKGHSGNPGGGLKNRFMGYSRRDVLDICQDRGYHPIHALIDIAQDPKSSNYLKAECADRVASFIMPKLKSVAITNAEGDGDGRLVISWGDETKTPAQQCAGQLVDATEQIIDAVVDDDTE